MTIQEPTRAGGMMDPDQLLALSYAMFEEWLALAISAKINVRRYVLQLEIYERDLRMVSEELEKSRLTRGCMRGSVVFNEWLGQKRAAAFRVRLCSEEVEKLRRHQAFVEHFLEMARSSTASVAAEQHRRVASPITSKLQDLNDSL
jgi:hypothetical protein